MGKESTEEGFGGKRGRWTLENLEENGTKKFKYPNIVSEIKCNWLGYLERLPEERMVKKIYLFHPGGRRLRGRPLKIWLGEKYEKMTCR